MQVLFIGQQGVLTGTRQTASSANEARVTALSRQLSREGHAVTVTCHPAFVSRNLRTVDGVRLVHVSGARAGGWRYAWAELRYAMRSRAQVIHVHNWRVVLLVPLLRMRNPYVSLVWTLSGMPNWSARWIRWALAGALRSFDAISTSTRAMQSRLLQEYLVKVDYVPDGYDKSEVPPVALRHYGIRKDQTYFMALVGTARELRLVAQAYKRSGLRNNLYVAAEEKGAWRRLGHEFSFLRFLGQVQGRPLRSLLAQTSGVIVADQQLERERLLLAMDAGAAIIVTGSDPVHQETAGVSVQFVRPGDEAGMVESIQAAFTSVRKRATWGSRARKRAQNHFGWERIVMDYLMLYHTPITRSVAIDSAVRRRIVQH